MSLKTGTVNEVPAVFLPANIDACALYRMFLPHLRLENTQFLFRPGGLNIGEFAEAKVGVVQRQVSPQNLMAIRRIKAAGLKVVYDLDDNLWNLPHYNPGKKIFQEKADGFAMCARECDHITVSTRGLRTAAITAFPFAKNNITVIPNAIDFNYFKQKEIVKDERVIIGWAGSNTHAGDLRDATSALKRVLNEYSHVYVCFIGSVPPDNELRTHPKVTCKPWVPVGEFANRLSSWGWDITIAPLEDNRFNRSKSNIKMLEAAALQIPCLASDVQPYNEFCSLGGDNLMWLLCSKQEQWYSKLKDLIESAQLRHSFGKQMYDIAKSWYNMDDIRLHWIRVFEKLAL